MATFSELEALFVNNSKFREIEAFLARFNPIKVMQASQSEIRNSAILAWLLDPHENHGLNDDFLRTFLAGALRDKESRISALEVLTKDLSDVEIRTEQSPDFEKKSRIDILIDCPKAGWVFVIENKLGSTQSARQLRKYYDGLRSRLEREGREATKIQGIYLTLDAEEPEHESKDSFVSYAHEDYAEQLSFLVKRKRDALSNKIVDFLEYFIEVVMENSAASHPEDERVRDIAKSLYREHRHTIDYIVESGTQTGLVEAFTGLIDGYPDQKYFQIGDARLVLVRSGKRWISFNPIEWQSLFDSADLNSKLNSTTWVGCETWRLPVPVGFWVEIKPTSAGDRIKVAVEVGPLKDRQQRLSLIEKIETRSAEADIQANFSSWAKKPNARYSIFKFKQSKIDPDNLDEINDRICELTKQLIPCITPVSTAISEWILEISSNQNKANTA